MRIVIILSIVLFFVTYVIGYSLAVAAGKDSPEKL